MSPCAYVSITVSNTANGKLSVHYDKGGAEIPHLSSRVNQPHDLSYIIVRLHQHAKRESGAWDTLTNNLLRVSRTLIVPASDFHTQISLAGRRLDRFHCIHLGDPLPTVKPTDWSQRPLVESRAKAWLDRPENTQKLKELAVWVSKHHVLLRPTLYGTISPTPTLYERSDLDRNSLAGSDYDGNSMVVRVASRRPSLDSGAEIEDRSPDL